jgi:hypothetical protein
MYLILFLCLLMVPAYYKTVSFKSKNGVLLFILCVSAFLFRVSLFGKYPPLATLNKETLLFSIIFLLIPFGIFIAYCLFNEQKTIRRRKDYFLRLLLSYILFGVLQQLFFLTVFTDAVYYLTLSYEVTLLISVVFFFIFHLNFGKELTKFLFCLFIFGVLNTYVYLYLGNIIPQLVAHGVIGSILYTAFSRKDQIKKRLS